VLPLLEDIVEYDAEAKGIVKDWNGTIQFSCPGGFGEYIEFKNGKAKAYRGTTSWPTVAFWFASPKDLNKMFLGEGIPMMVPWKGLTHIGMIKGFTELSKRLEYYMKTPEEQLPDEDLPFIVKLKLFAAVRAVKEVGENDPHVSGYAANLPNGIAELRIKGGPAAHIRIRNGILMPDKGSVGKPNALMEFKDFKVANALFNDELDAMAAIGSCDIKLEGQIPLIDNMNAILDRIALYLS
jgi:hypothetical protein